MTSKKVDSFEALDVWFMDEDILCCPPLPELREYVAAKNAYIAQLEYVLAAVCEESTLRRSAWWHRQLASALEALVEEE